VAIGYRNDLGPNVLCGLSKLQGCVRITWKSQQKYN
jgi:hypothetical protein